MKSAYRLLAATLAIFALFPCSIDTSPSFFPWRRPEKFDSAFLRGELGIIPSTLSARYKLIAWRYLSGLPLDSDEQQAILDRLKVGDFSSAAMEQWRAASRRSGDTDFFYLNIGKPSRLDPGTYYDNCLADTFSAAARTLDDRTTAYANPVMLKAWLTAQNQVFQNCASDKPAYPDDPGAGLPPLARADREYQIAAAHFYAEDLEGAEQRFRAIAADNASPWRETSAYMVARTLIREGVLMHKPEAFPRAKSELQKIATGPFHDSAKGLIAYIDTLSDPAAALKALAGRLALPHPGPAFSDALEEGVFALTTSRFHEALTRPDPPEPFGWVGALEADRTGHSLQRWRQSRSTLWLVAALIHAEPGEEANADLMDAALKVPESSPAYDTVTFNSIRLMVGAGQRDQARRRLNVLLGGGRRNLNSVDNAYREQRMSLATSFDDFLRWAPRRPIGIAEEDEEDYNAGSVDDSPILGYDSLHALNGFAPLPRLIDAANSRRLPEGSRAKIAISAWTRAFILGDREAANNLSLLLAKLHGAWASDPEAFRASNGDGKLFAGAFLILRHADFHPQVWQAFAPDWWCADPLPGKPDSTLPEAALSPKERIQAASEIQRIHAAGPAQTFLAPIIMSWSRAHPEDPRVPEALHRLVRVTRYGCYGVVNNGVISKAAFDLLQHRYPDNEWARKTPYWFNR